MPNKRFPQVRRKKLPWISRVKQNFRSDHPLPAGNATGSGGLGETKKKRGPNGSRFFCRNGFVFAFCYAT